MNNLNEQTVTLTALVNGMLCTELSLSNRALHYGDGVFETIACANGEPLQWARHMRRLAHGCAALSLPQPDQALLLAEARQLIQGNTAAILKIIISRDAGINARGYQPALPCTASRMLFYYPWPQGLETLRSEGVLLRLSKHKLSMQPALVGVKHLNRLDQVIARAECDDPAVYDSLLCDHSGCVLEASSANLFIIRSGRCYTADLSKAGLMGSMRERLLEWAAAEGQAIEITNITPAELAIADEAFISNAIIGILPIREIRDTAQYSAPGPVTRHFISAYCNGAL